MNKDWAYYKRLWDECIPLSQAIEWTEDIRNFWLDQYRRHEVPALGSKLDELSTFDDEFVRMLFIYALMPPDVLTFEAAIG